MKRIVVRKTIDTKGYDLPRMKDPNAHYVWLLAVSAIVVAGAVVVALMVKG